MATYDHHRHKGREIDISLGRVSGRRVRDGNVVHVHPPGRALRPAVIMPACNAGLTIETVFARTRPAAREHILRYAVVDHGSAEDTGRALERIRVALAGVVLLRDTVNRGGTR